MKAFGAFLFAGLTLSSLAASAQLSPSEEWRVPDFQYISWCDKNAVTTNDDRGQERILADCSASDLNCELEKVIVAGRPAIHGVCR